MNDDAPITECPQCHFISYGGAKYCFLDGSLMGDAKMNCRYCGAALQSTYRFCKWCGHITLRGEEEKEKQL